MTQARVCQSFVSMPLVIVILVMEGVLMPTCHGAAAFPCHEYEQGLDLPESAARRPVSEGGVTFMNHHVPLGLLEFKESVF